MTQWSADSHVSVAHGVFAAEVDGEMVLLHQESGVYFSLNEVGTRIWSVLATGAQLGEIHAALLREYAVAPESAWNDLVRLIAAMKAQGLVATGPSD